MAQDIKLKIGADTGDLEKAFGATIKKIQGEAAKIKLPDAAARAVPGGESVRESAQTNRALTQRIREEKAGLDIINREISKKKALIDEISKKQEAAVRGSREELALVQRINKEKERLQQAERIGQIQKESFRKAEEASNRAMGVSSKGPGPSPMEGIIGKIGVAGIIGGITTAVVQGISQIAGSPSRGLIAGGSAVSNTAGRELSSFYNGNLPTELAFTKEKREAKEMADKQEAAERAKDTAKSAAGIGLIGTAGATALSTGWTGVGALAAGGQALAAMGALFGSQRMRAQTTSALTKNLFPQTSRENHEEYENLIAQQNAEDYRKNYEAKKQLNPLKVLAVDEYNQNSQRDLDFQRQMGLNTQSFRGTFKNQIFDAGFTGEQGMGMASSIMGAGGSTRSTTGNAALGLQAGRNLDMTNAGSVLGKLSGSMGSAETTKESFVKLLAEGTRVGLDGSDFREENRKFVESAAQMISKSGTTSGEGVDQLLSQFGRFFGDKTMTGIDAGKGAFELYRETSMATTGPRGTMRAAGMLTDPTISKLSRDSREALFNMPIDQLTPDNPAIMAMAEQAKVSPEDLIKAQNKVTSKSANLFKNSDIATQNLANVKKKYGLQSSIGFQGPLSEKAYQEIGSALGESNIAQVKEHPELGQDQRKTSALSDALSAGDPQKQSRALEDAKKQQLNAPSSGRPEDETNKIRAEMSRQVNQIFMDMKDSIVPAAGAAANFVEQIKKLNAEMMALPESQRAAFANKNILPAFGVTPSTAPSAGSPNSGGGSGHQ